MANKRQQVPVHRGFLLRPRIEALLRQGLGNALVTVVAGPGYDKTRSVAAFAQTMGRRLAWLHLTPHDNDPDRFWRNLVHAFTPEMPALAARLELITFPRIASQYDAFRHDFARAVYDGEQVVLICDDYDCLENDELRFFFEYLVRMSLENFCLILISAKRTDIHVAGMESLGGVFYITAEDLRYTEDEVAASLRAQGLQLPDATIRQITRETDGWPLSINLYAMQHLRSPGEAGVSNRHFSLVMELFEKECFTGYHEDIRRMLVKLSLLPSFSLTIIKDIGGCDLSAMTDVLTAHMFIFYDHGTALFVMQKMYHDFLALKQVLLDGDEVARVLVTAGEQMLAGGHLHEAMDCFWRCRNYDRFLQALTSFPHQRKSQAFATYVLECLDAFPASYPDQNTVNFIRAFYLLNVNEVHRAEAVFQRLAQALHAEPQSPQHRALLGEVYLALSDITLLQSTDGYADYTRKAAACLPQGSAIWNPQLMRFGNNDVLFLTGNEPGNLDRLVQQILDVAPLSDAIANGNGYGFELLFAAEAAFFRCDMEKASTYCHQAILKAEVYRQHDIICNARTIQLRIAVYQGDYDRALALLETTAAYVDSTRHPDLREMSDCFSGWFYLMVQDLDRLPGWMSDYNHDYFARLPINNGRNRIYYPIHQMALHAYGEANFTMRQFEGMFEEKGLWTVLLTFYTMRAVCYMMTDDLGNALAFLWKAYDMSHANGVILPFVEFGNLMRTLLDSARASKDYAFDPAWIGTVYDQATTFARHHAGLISEHQRRMAASPQGGVRLTPRETEVLRHMANGMTREEISEALGISVNGVKKHITAIYNKLGAINRADAVRIAAQRDDLLQPTLDKSSRIPYNYKKVSVI